MEGDRKFQVIFVVVSALLFGFAYGVGYYVGKGRGIEEEKGICEIEKKQIIKTLSRITPVSRPEPVEEKVVTEEIPKETENKTQEVEEQKETSVQRNIVSNTENKTTNVSKAPSTTFSENKGNGSVKEEYVTESKEILKNKEVLQNKTDKNELRQNQTGNYYLQVGVFRNKENALKLAERLQNFGFKPQTIYTGRYVKVAVGYFQTKSEVLKAKKELSSHGINAILKRRK